MFYTFLKGSHVFAGDHFLTDRRNNFDIFKEVPVFTNTFAGYVTVDVE